MSDCAGCGGAGKLIGFACPGFRRIEVPCPRCAGSGVAPAWQADAMARGRVIADARRSLDLSCTEAAANWGVTRRELQDAELGTTDPMTWPAKLAAFRAASAPKKEETRG